MPRLVLLMVAATVVWAPCAAHALDPVTVLAIDGQDIEGQAASPSLYDTARTQVALHPELSLNDVPPQALDDVLLAAGCSSLNEECARDLATLLGSRWLIWGTASDDGVQLHLRDLTGEAPARAVRLAHLPTTTREEVLLARRLLWGDVGELQVTSNPLGAEVFVDGRSVGTTPLTLPNEAPRLVTVRVQSPSHADFERVVELDINQTVVHAALIPSLATAAPRSRTNAAPAAYLTTSAALLLAGIGTAVSAGQTQSRFDDAVARPSLNRDRAEALQTRGTRRATASNVLIPLGGVGTVGSTAWLILRRNQRDDGPEMTESGAWSRYHGTARQSGTSNANIVAQ